MIEKYLLILLPCLVMSVKISTLKRCSCEEYGVDICDAYFYCSWNDGACGPLQCSNKSLSKCTASSTSFNCIWDFSNDQCVQHTYSCTEFGSQSLCQDEYVHGQNCSWNKNYGCIEFSCSDSTSCDLTQCSLINGMCGDPISQTLNCEAMPSNCVAADGKGKFCLSNDQRVCKSYDSSLQCYQLSDQMELCLLAGCSYSLITFTCADLTCSTLAAADDCTYIYDNINKQITVCYWDQTFCREATETDLQKFTLENCIYNTRFNYEWQDSKCQECKNLVSSEDSYSNSHILIGFALLMFGYL